MASNGATLNTDCKILKDEADKIIKAASAYNSALISLFTIINKLQESKTWFDDGTGSASKFIESMNNDYKSYDSFGKSIKDFGAFLNNYATDIEKGFSNRL